jgi:2-methylcitrate dehydratase PrpD
MHTADSDQGATARLASFVHDTVPGDIPGPARHAARRAFVNIIGCCLGGARHPIVDAAALALLPFGGPQETTLIGRSERTDALTAALLNALSSAAYSFDDTHAEAIIHPSGAVASALLALAEQQTMGGEDFMLAFVLGVDVACRLSKAVSVAPAAGDIGWSQTGIAAGVGAAAAAAKALRLDAEGMTWAMGIAALEGAGFRVAHGSMAATMLFGHAAQSGLRAALLAQRGLSAPAAPLEGQYGYLSLFARAAHPAYLTEALGLRFEVEALAFKPYPCGVVIHPSVDAALSWRNTVAASGHDIQNVQLTTHPSAVALGFRRHPANELEAKVSLCHWVAVALALGRAGLAEGREALIDEPEVMRLRECIAVVGSESLQPDAATMTVTLASGQRHTVSIDHCIGSVTHPMSDKALGDKFKGQAALHFSGEEAVELLSACWAVDARADVATIAHLCRR